MYAKPDLLKLILRWVFLFCSLFLCPLQVFGITLATAPAMMPQDRHLGCVELWAGVATISRAASIEGMESVAMDIRRIPGGTDKKGPHTENILLKDFCGWLQFAAPLFS